MAEEYCLGKLGDSDSGNIHNNWLRAWLEQGCTL
jgi:hypothetical protein